ncbi:hypothetical protein K440DRAFT_645757 [Wilcoxina mikolae CBS 423.85]|nr:hypothetical protein K440DRAFT_645757 [Wilcoxina mikolae CBS 423.85]
MGLFRRSSSCKDRYIRKCKDWIEHPRPWMHKELNIPPNCSSTCPAQHLIPILILLLLGLATAYVYKFRKHPPESFQKKKMITLYIPPHKIPYELSISDKSPLENTITKMLTDDAPSHPLYAAPRRWVLFNTDTRKMVHPSTVNDASSDGRVYLCVSPRGAERFAKSEVGEEVGVWIDEVAGEGTFTPTGSTSGYTSGYEHGDNGDNLF